MPLPSLTTVAALCCTWALVFWALRSETVRRTGTMCHPMPCPEIERRPFLGDGWAAGPGRAATIVRTRRALVHRTHATTQARRCIMSASKTR
jgi:hypothetical protein